MAIDETDHILGIVEDGIFTRERQFRVMPGIRDEGRGFEYEYGSRGMLYKAEFHVADSGSDNAVKRVGQIPTIEHIAGIIAVGQRT